MSVATHIEQTWKHLSLPGAGVFVLAQVFALRLLSTGRYGSLNSAPNADVLWIAHTASKGLVLALLLMLAVVLLRRPERPAIAAPRHRRLLFGLQLVLFSATLLLQQTLPPSGQSAPLSMGQILSYAGAIACLSGLTLSGILLLLPAGWRTEWSALTRLSAIGAVVLLTLLTQTKLIWLIDGPRMVIEDTTVRLSLWLYGLFGTTNPTITLIDGTPLMSVPEFAIRISPNCSGYQGMVSATVLLGAYCWLERGALHMGRAVWVIAAAVLGTFLLNGLRIALLFHVGVEYSAEVAVRGFHSHFGTLSVFLATAVGILVLERSAFRNQPRAVSAEIPLPVSTGGWTGLEMLPLAAMLLTGIVVGLTVNVVNWLYAVPVAVGAIGLWLLRRSLAARLSDGPSLAGLFTGVAVFALWIALIPPDAAASSIFATALFGAPPVIVALWIAVRIFGACVVVPIAEELAFRGVLADLVEENLSGHPGLSGPVRATVIAVATITLPAIAFGLLHSTILAGVVAGLCYGALAWWRRGLADVIMAHAITNFLIAVTVLAFGHWSYW